MILLTDSQVIAAILRGEVGVLPTDTVYGLVARATNAAAVTRLHALKHRERKPGTIIAANVQQLHALGLSHDDLHAVKHLWPNPLSIILKPQIDTLPHLHQGLGDFPVRIPADQQLNQLLLQTGPLVTTSANHPGEAPANTIKQAHHYFGDAVDFYVDGGDLAGRLPSTIARVTEGGLEVLREGACKLPPTLQASS